MKPNSVKVHCLHVLKVERNSVNTRKSVCTTVFDKKQRALDEILEADEFGVLEKTKANVKSGESDANFARATFATKSISNRTNFRTARGSIKSIKILTIAYLLMDLIKSVKDLIIGTGSNTDLVSAKQLFSAFRRQLSKVDSGGLHEPFFVCLSANAERFECSSSKTGYLRVNWSL